MTESDPTSTSSQVSERDRALEAEDEVQLRQIREDQRLIREAQAGRPGALDRLAQRLSCVSRILSVLNARSGGHLSFHDVADLAQDTLVVILRKLDTFEGRSTLEGWAYRICYFEFMNQQRSRQRRAVRTQSEDSVPEPSLKPEPREPQLWGRLERALEAIPVAEARIIRWKHLQDLTFEDIVRTSSTPRGTVKARYYRGMKRLRSMLGAEPEGDLQ